MNNWFIGVVEDIEDPTQTGKVKVRVVHPLLQAEQLSVDDLPWSVVLMPATSGSNQGVGTSPTWLSKGDQVFGMWLDESKNMSVIMGSWHGLVGEEDEQKNDVNDLARGNNIIEKSQTGPEPETSYAAKYPHNKVISTARGHVIELDDTPDNERIHIYHRNGTYIEIDNDKMIVKASGDSYFISDKKTTIYSQGDLLLESAKNLTLKAGKVVVDSSSVDFDG